jgi:hypothetical protein
MFSTVCVHVVGEYCAVGKFRFHRVAVLKMDLHLATGDEVDHFGRVGVLNIGLSGLARHLDNAPVALFPQRAVVVRRGGGGVDVGLGFSTL